MYKLINLYFIYLMRTRLFFKSNFSILNLLSPLFLLVPVDRLRIEWFITNLQDFDVVNL